MRACMPDGQTRLQRSKEQICVGYIGLYRVDAPAMLSDLRVVNGAVRGVAC